MDLKIETRRISEKLINAAIIAGTLYIIPALGASLFRIVDLGWNNIYVVHLVIATLFFALYLIRNRLAFYLRAHGLLVLFMLISLAGPIWFRTVGASFFIFVVVVIATLVFGKRSGIVYFIIFFIAYFIIAFLNYTNVLHPDIDFNKYLNYKTSWIAQITGYLFGTGVIIYTAHLFYQLFTNSIKSLINKTDELNQTLSKLSYSEERFKAFMDRYPFPITIKDKSLKFTYVNKALKDLALIYDQNQVEFQTSLQIFPEKVANLLEDADNEVFKTNNYISFDADSEFDGRYLHYKVIKFPLKSSLGETMVGTITINTTEQKLAVQKMEISERKYRSIFEGSIDGFIYSDKNGNIIDCNHSFIELLGYSKEELLNKNLREITPKKWEFKELDFAEIGQFFEIYSSDIYEKELINKSGNKIPVELNIQEISIGHGIFYWIIVRDISERKEFEKKLYHVMIEAEERERERYARELHDGMGPLLSTCKIYFHTISTIEDESSRSKHIQRAGELLDDALKSMKEISNNLSPDILRRYGLSQALNSFISKLRNVTHINFNIQSNLQQRLPEIIEFTIYRALTEMVNNTVKHAESSEIIIHINQIDNELKIIYTDNGKGFDYQQVKNKNQGFGLINIESRIKKIGEIYVNSSPGKGFNANIIIKTKLL